MGRNKKETSSAQVPEKNPVPADRVETGTDAASQGAVPEGRADAADPGVVPEDGADAVDPEVVPESGADTVEQEVHPSKKGYKIVCCNAINKEIGGVKFVNGVGITDDAYTAAWFGNRAGYTVSKEQL